MCISHALWKDYQTPAAGLVGRYQRTLQPSILCLAICCALLACSTVHIAPALVCARLLTVGCLVYFLLDMLAASFPLSPRMDLLLAAIADRARAEEQARKQEVVQAQQQQRHRS